MGVDQAGAKQVGHHFLDRMSAHKGPTSTPIDGHPKKDHNQGRDNAAEHLKEEIDPINHPLNPDQLEHTPQFDGELP